MKNDLRLLMQDKSQKLLFGITLKYNSEKKQWEHTHEGVTYIVIEQN